MLDDDLDRDDHGGRDDDLDRDDDGGRDDDLDRDAVSNKLSSGQTEFAHNFSVLVA